MWPAMPRRRRCSRIPGNARQREFLLLTAAAAPYIGRASGTDGTATFPGPFMTDSANGDAMPAGTEDRRTNEVLRSLVSEMLERVREVTRRTSVWSAEERAQAEAELEAIMAHVRREATTERKED